MMWRWAKKRRGREGGGSLVKEHRSCEVLPYKAEFEWCIFSLLFTQKKKLMYFPVFFCNNAEKKFNTTFSNIRANYVK